MNNVKIGARELTKSELKLTLPTYEQIMVQMKQMRQTAKDSNNSSFQKTNNIGILGCRGAGKTSILQTIKKNIETESHNSDIVLDIIIPENMSESSTLMENILGLLKVKVDEIEKSTIQKRESNYCIKSNGKSLTQKYNDLIRTYTYIQKEYRDILISEFTSENEYVKKSKEVFNSDFEFQKNWKSFLEDILNEMKELRKSNNSSMLGDEEKSNEAMFIVFIDDIDLSTYRCTDVVHTLLTYLSNSNIITFISGDIDTFEEALTLDFLRKEKALNADVFQNTYYNGDSNLLERKRQLSYEYLKKVLPPMYRHQVKIWNLEERANYIIETSESPLSLKDLLLQKLNSYIPSYTFEYGEEEKRVLPYFFHMFDSTARGLNNVYAVLQQMSSDHSSISKEDAYKEKKLLIETIISSNQLYNQKRSFLLEKVIQLGVDEENSHIDFGALREYYDYTVNDINIEVEEFKQLEIGKTRKTNIQKVKKRRNDLLLTVMREHFSFFLLTYFSAQMLLSPEHEAFASKDFCGAKNMAFNALLSELNGHVKNYNICPYEKKNVKNEKETNDKSDCKYNISDSRIMNFISECDFAFGLVYIHNDVMLKNLDNIGEFEKQIYLLYRALSDCGKLECLDNVSKLENDLTEIAVILSSNRKFTEIRLLFQTMVEELIENKLFDDSVKRELLDDLRGYSTEEQENLEERRKYLEEFSVLIFNTIEHYYSNLKEPKKEDINQLSDKDWKHRIQYMQRITEKKLWKDQISQIVYDFLEEELSTRIQKCIVQEYSNIEIAPNFYKAFEEFRGIYKGGRNTKANELQNYLISFKSTIDESIRCNYNDYIDAKEKIRALATNNRVWYGKNEARNMLNAISESMIHTNIDEYPLLKPLLYFYRAYYMEQYDFTGIRMVDDGLRLFRDAIMKLLKKNSDEIMMSYMDKLSDGEEELSFADFEKLF